MSATGSFGIVAAHSQSNTTIVNQDYMREQLRLAIARSVDNARARLRPSQRDSFLVQVDRLVDDLVLLHTKPHGPLTISIDNLIT